MDPMNDERFDRDLAQVLRDAAGQEAPVSLRQRLSSITDQAPVSPRLWFAPPPLKLSMAVVAFAGVLVLALLLMPRTTVGPTPSSSSSPTESPAPSSAPLPSGAPTTAPTFLPTQEPTPVPTPVLSNWTAIAWSDPFVPFPHQENPYRGVSPWTTTIQAILPWNGAYVGAGYVSHAGVQCEQAAFFHSSDGSAWTTAATFSSGEEFAFFMCPDFLVPLPNGDLLAIAQERLWTTRDGVGWSETTTTSWNAVWEGNGLRQQMEAASAPSGVVVIGVDLDTGHSVVVHSADGLTWERVPLPAAERPIVRDIATADGRFVIVGRDGQADGAASSDHPAVVPGMGLAAAWTSVDGIHWTESAVDANSVQGGGMSQVWAGAAGMLAIGNDTASDYYPSTDYAAGNTVAAWVSADGTAWNRAGSLGAELPPMGLLASDGTQMVGLGLHLPWIDQEPAAWASLDGLHWTQLALSGPALDVGYLTLEPMLSMNPPDTALWVLPDGLLALGSGEGVPVDQPYADQWLRFGAAAAR
jgi:hypothetical protein